MRHKKSLTLLLVPFFILTSCGKDDNSSLPSGTPANQSSITDYVEEVFGEYVNLSAHTRLKNIAQDKDGFAISFNASHKENGVYTDQASFYLARRGDISWAEFNIRQSSEYIGVDLPYNEKGAIKYLNDDESLYEVYYANNSNVYEYVGNEYYPVKPFSIQDLEAYFELNDALYATLRMQQIPKLGVYANGRRCLCFDIRNVGLDGGEMVSSRLQIAFDYETRLIMDYVYWYGSGSNLLMDIFSVTALEFSKNPPELHH